MKKVLLFILVLFMPFMVVNAAYAYVFTVNGESLRRGGDAILNNTVKWIESEEYSGGILILNNYNGGEVKLECKGTGMNQVFAVQLNGNNTITSDKIGFLMTDKVEFIGDGTLTINAPIPISGVEEVDVLKQTNTITIYGKDNKTVLDTQEEKNPEVEEEKTPEVKEEKELLDEELIDDKEEVPEKGINKILYLVIIGCAVALLLFLAFGISKFNKKRS